MKCISRLFGIACFAFLIANPADAELVLGLSPAAINLTDAGGTVTFAVTALGNNGETIQSVDVYLNASGPNAVTFGSATNTAGFDLFDPTTPPGVSDFAFGGANLFTLPVDVSSSTNLFTFEATFAPNLGVTDQVYILSFDPSNNNFGVALGAGSPPLDLSLASASVTVTAIPEPSISAFLGLASCGAMVRFRKRRFPTQALAA